jgi:hypothetical protein
LAVDAVDATAVEIAAAAIRSAARTASTVLRSVFSIRKVPL